VSLGKALAAGLVLVAVVVGALYWWLYRPQHAELQEAQGRAAEAEAQVTRLEAQVGRLEGRVADLETVRDQLQRTSVDLQEQVAEKEKELLALRSTQDELLTELKQEIADRQIEVERIRDQLRVEMVDEILFDSGEAHLKPEGLAVMKRIGAVLKRASNRRIEVQGHTDNVPIRGELARRYPTNWELSAARATNVARFLQDTAEVEAALLSAVALSEYRPRDGNDTEAGRRRNRRIEILLGPPLPAPAPAPAAAPAPRAGP